MTRFLPPKAFSATTEAISSLPSNLERTGTSQYLVSNMVGDFIRLTEEELNRLVDLRVRPGDGLYEKAYHASDRARAGCCVPREPSRSSITVATLRTVP